jgi:drug/metabolite transporter (DMT)-like permease
MKNKKLFASLMILIAAISWGLAYSVQTIMSDLGTFTITFFKCIGGLLLLAIALIKKAKFTKTTIIFGIIVGAINFLGCASQQKGLELSSTTNASFITSLYIVMVPLLGLFLGKKVNKKTWLAIVIALIGMYLLCISGEFKLRIGDIILVFAALFYALQIVFIDNKVGEVEPLPFAAVQQVTASILAGSIMIFVEKPNPSTLLSYWPLLAFLSLISGALSMFIQNRFQPDVGPTLASLIMSFESVFGALFAWIILNQALSLREIIGGALIFIAIIIAE